MIDFSLAGKVVAVTGGAGIIGTELCTNLSALGASVAVLDADGDKAAELAKQIATAEAPAVGCAVDVASAAQLENTRDFIEAELGEVDVLVNNAAAKSPNFFEPFETFPLDDWNHVLNINLTGVMLGCQVFGARMAARGRGSIINTLSIYGIVAPDQRIYEGSEYQGRAINTPAVYSASKAGVWGLTRYLAAYWGERGVRVNALTPGGVASGQNEEFARRYAARVPLGRMAQRQEMVGAVAFLASDAASYITGHNLVVDGGLTVW